MLVSSKCELKYKNAPNVGVAANRSLNAAADGKANDGGN